ncbi:MAG: DUF6468 domain-containing protein [Robiginitomaculum sp.]|nr:DUF6468 domain-containing protein [Robiginitomaculum sp.]MDQ7076341.1 DUF6468 domain-containing protein [Robiginitomaculum sp.]
MTLALGFEILLAFLLLVTVFYCWRLDRRLNALRNGQDGMREAVTDLIKATSQAEACIQGLRDTAGQSSVELDARITKAQKLAADLQRLSRQSRLTSPPVNSMPRASNTSAAPRTPGLMDRLREAG